MSMSYSSTIKGYLWTNFNAMNYVNSQGISRDYQRNIVHFPMILLNSLRLFLLNLLSHLNVLVSLHNMNPCGS